MSISAPVPDPPVGPWSADAEQHTVIGHREGVLLVVGGPGSGKTSTVVRHVQRRIVEDGLAPDSCLVLAPTRQAAARLRAAVGRGLGKTFTDPLARTPSSLAFAVLRRAAAGAGEPLPRLLSGAEQDVILRELLAGHQEDGAGPAWPDHLTAALPTAGFRGQLRDLLMRAVEHGLESDDLIGLARDHDRPEWGAAAAVLEEYDQVTALSEPGGYDPAWICTAAADRLEEDPTLLRAIQAQLRLVVVDDAQELTASAARLVSVLAGRGLPVVLVGDPDVTVLGFRGAVPGRFVELAHDLHGEGVVATVTLRTRYRGAAPLTEACARIADRIGAVSGTAHRRPVQAGVDAAAADAGRSTAGTGVTHGPPAGVRPVEVAVARSRSQEAAHVAQWMRRAHLVGGVPWDEIAVIARSGGVQDSLRRALAAGGVPVRSDRAGTPLGQDPAVTPLLLAFDVVTRSAAGPWQLTGDEAVSLLTSPLGAVDPVQLRRLRRQVRSVSETADRNRPTEELLASLILDEDLALTVAAQLPPELAPLVRVGTVLRAGRSRFLDEGSAEDILWALWGSSGLASLWEDQALAGGALGARADRDLDAVLVLFGTAATYVERLPGRSPRSFLDHVRSAEVAADTLVVGARTGSAVEVLTPQAAAGRQWRLVAVVGVQDGVWPDLRLRDTLLGAQALVAAVHGRAVAGPEALRSAQSQVRADELRQFYLACSRAGESLLVTAVASTDEQPSGLLDLIDPDHGSRPPVDAPPPLTLRGLVGQLRREAVLAQREGRVDERDRAVEGLLVLAAAEVAGADPARWWDVREVSTDADLVPAGPVRVSPSRVQTYLDCPLRWFLTSRGADQGGAVSAEIGTLVHDIIAAAPEAPEEVLTAEVDRRWAELGLRAGWVADKQQARAKDMVRRYAAYSREAAGEGRALLGTELEMRARLGSATPDAPDVDIVGRVDRLEQDADGRLVVLDLKTSRNKPTKDEISTHAQLAAYQVAVQAGAFDEIVADARSGGAQLVNLGTTERTITQAQPALDDAEDPLWASTMLRAAGAQMAGHRFAAKDLQRRCRTCPARFCCPLQPEGESR